MKYLVEKFNEETCESIYGVYGSSAVDKFDDNEYCRKYRQGRFIPARFINDLREKMTHTFLRIKELGGKITSYSYYSAGVEYLGETFRLAHIEFADGTEGNARIEARIEFRYLCGMASAAYELGVTFYIGKDDTIKVFGCDSFYKKH